MAPSSSSENEAIAGASLVVAFRNEVSAAEPALIALRSSSASAWALGSVAQALTASMSMPSIDAHTTQVPRRPQYW